MAMEWGPDLFKLRVENLSFSWFRSRLFRFMIWMEDYDSVK